MATPLRQTSPSSLAGVIKAYCAEQRDKGTFLDDATLGLLKRLAHSDEAARAFKALKRYQATVPGISDVFGMNVVHWCIMARLLIDKRRGFPAELAKAARLVALAERVEKYLVELRKVVHARNTPNLLKFLDQQTIEDLKSGIKIISAWTERRQIDAANIELRLGASRKKHMDAAAENAAIWTLASNVVSTTGKPHELQVARLASVILQKDVAVDRVHSVVRLYRPRWAKRIRRRQFA